MPRPTVGRMLGSVVLKFILIIKVITIMKLAASVSYVNNSTPRSGVILVNMIIVNHVYFIICYTIHLRI